MKRIFFSIATFCCFTLMASAPLFAQQGNVSNNNLKSEGETELSSSTSTSDVPKALRFKVNSIDGKEVELSQYQGKVIVIVNTASRCGMTPQYKELQQLYEEFKDSGLVVLGFPCNQFGGQEPGTEAQIAEFCSTNYGVTFDMFAKVDVNGGNADALFKYLTQKEAKPVGSGAIKWNFEKFIIDRSGELVARFGSRVKPSTADFRAVIQKALQ